MANNMVQEVSFTNAKWDIKPVQPHQNTFATCKLTEPGLLDETIEVVKEKVWSFRNAWKGVAEAFCRIGMSPTILGYSYPITHFDLDCFACYFYVVCALNIGRSVPLHEDGYVKEHSEDVLALAKVDADEDKPPALLLRNVSGCSVPEEDNLLLEEDEHEDDTDHGFVESAKMELVERKSLTRSAG